MLFPTLTARPFHDDRAPRPPRLAEAVTILETMATVVRSELNGLRHAKGFQPFRGRSEERPAAADGIGHLTHDAGDWSVFYLLAGGVDCSSQQGLCPKTTRILVHAPPPRHRARTRCPHLTWLGVSMRSGPDTKTGSSVETRLEVAPAPPLLCSAAAQRRPCCGNRWQRGLPCQCSSAFFSVLAPGTHICAHCGPGNFRLRLHLGLRVPHGEGCRIRCADQTRTWREGEVLVLVRRRLTPTPSGYSPRHIRPTPGPRRSREGRARPHLFRRGCACPAQDDAYEHEVWNDTPQARVVLCVDIWHPDFSEAEVKFLEATLSRGDARAVERGDSLIASAMAAYAGRDNAPLFEGLE